MKKVGILTFHFSNHNYGAVLQAFASYVILKKYGYSPTIINLLPVKDNTIKSFFKSFLTGSIKFELFRKRYLKQTKKIFTLENLRKLNEYFDIFYVGSDQIWRPSMAKSLLEHYFLDFVDEEKIKISYAVSFGINEWNEDEKLTNSIKYLISRFDKVLVREIQGVEICSNKFNIKAECVLDPTLLLSKDDYVELLNLKDRNKKSKFIGIYLLSDKELKGDISKKINSQLCEPHINMYGNIINLFGFNIFHFNHVRTWLNHILNSELIITDSFHCMVFSIIFKRNFIIINNKYRGNNRILNLLEPLNLMSRFCEKPETFDLTKYLTPIDFDSISIKLSKEITNSITLLLRGLNQTI
ncbi:MAG: polysaccharide pyruvyl transferase family protein [Tissierellia bacterium]|nr:polysaccharide pyruvyl transferase family protein [Tissierellia bacterium]